MISIVLPSYNGEKYIRQSIESVINQTYKDWELIIVNDCSKDSTGDIADEYQRLDKRIRVIHNSINQKLPSSLNIGFENAVGNYYTWTSDDNVFKTEALERMLAKIEINSNIDFLFANYTMIDPDDYIIYDVETGPVEELPLKDVVGACFLYRSKIHRDIGGYNKDKFLVEDYDFWLRAYEKFNFLHLKENLYYYRIHGGSLTAERKDAIEKATINLLEEHINNISNQKNALKKKVAKKILAYYKKNKQYLKYAQYKFIK